MKSTIIKYKHFTNFCVLLLSVDPNLAVIHNQCDSLKRFSIAGFWNRQGHFIQVMKKGARQKVLIDGNTFQKRSSNKTSIYYICSERKRTGWVLMRWGITVLNSIYTFPFAKTNRCQASACFYYLAKDGDRVMVRHSHNHSILTE